MKVRIQGRWPSPKTYACDALAAATALLVSGAALAQTSPYYVGVAQSLGHESNLLRLSDGVATPANASRSDTLSSTSLLAGLDQPIGRQRLRGDVALRANRYSSNDIYNNQSYTANLGLDWETINRWSGKVSTSANRSLLTFNLRQNGTADGLLTERNYEDTKTFDASAQVGVVTQYSMYAAAGYRQVQNSLSAPVVQARNFNQQTLSGGVRWQPSSLLNLGLGLRGTKGRYPQYRLASNGNGYEADSFKRQDIDLSANWAPSGQSTLNARLSTGKTDYELDALRSYSGVTGALTWVWQASGKLRMTTSLSRDTGQESYGITVFQTPASADYSRVNTTARLAADWAMSSKVSLNASLAHTDRDQTRNVSTLPGANSSGKERSQVLSIGARWAPLRSVLVGCNINSDRVSGSGFLDATHISGNGYSCYGQLMLQ